MTETQTFDLRELSNQQYQAKRFGRYVMIGTALAVIALSVTYWGPIFRSVGPGNNTPSGQLEVDYTVLAATPVVLAVVAWFLWNSRPGPEGLKVDMNGVHIQYDSGRAIDLDWKDPRVWIDLYNLPSILGPPTAVDPRPLTFLKSSHTTTQPILLSRESYEAVLDEAATQKVSVTRLTVPKWNLGGLPTRTIRYRIRSLGS
jgi:hypothetical protein